MGGRKFRTRIYPGWKSESKNCDAPPGPDSTESRNVTRAVPREERIDFRKRACGRSRYRAGESRRHRMAEPWSEAQLRDLPALAMPGCRAGRPEAWKIAANVVDV